MTAARIAVVLLVAACGGGGRAPARPSPAPAPGSPDGTGGASDCRPAYAEYERRWRTARSEELAGMPDAFTPDAIEEIVSDEVETLPARDELQKLRLMYALVEIFIPDASWVVAFTAAERAIDTCGERARRPG